MSATPLGSTRSAGAADDTTTPPPDEAAEQPGRLRRFARHPLGWMLTGFLALTVVASLTQSDSTSPWAGVLAVVGAVAAVYVYRYVMRRVAGREAPEISRTGARREALLGAGVGLGFMVVSVLLITLFGGYSFHWSDHNPLEVLVAAAGTAVGAAVVEELMMRGFVLQALEQWRGSRTAILISGLLFGLLHFFNPNGTLWSSLAIATEAGLLLGAAFLWRRSIWFVAGLHFAWNATQTLLGVPTSGHTVKGWLVAEPSGADLISGGSFGLEASIIPVLVGLVIAIPMLVLAHRKGNLVSRSQGDLSSYNQKLQAGR
jgi:hypothetical protein